MQIDFEKWIPVYLFYDMLKKQIIDVGIFYGFQTLKTADFCYLQLVRVKF